MRRRVPRRAEGVARRSRPLRTVALGGPARASDAGRGAACRARAPARSGHARRRVGRRVAGAPAWHPPDRVRRRPGVALAGRGSAPLDAARLARCRRRRARAGRGDPSDRGTGAAGCDEAAPARRAGCARRRTGRSAERGPAGPTWRLPGRDGWRRLRGGCRGAPERWAGARRHVALDRAGSPATPARHSRLIARAASRSRSTRAGDRRWPCRLCGRVRARAPRLVGGASGRGPRGTRGLGATRAGPASVGHPRRRADVAPHPRRHPARDLDLRPRLAATDGSDPMHGGRSGPRRLARLATGMGRGDRRRRGFGAVRHPAASRGTVAAPRRQCGPDRPVRRLDRPRRAGPRVRQGSEHRATTHVVGRARRRRYEHRRGRGRGRGDRCLRSVTRRDLRAAARAVR